MQLMTDSNPDARALISRAVHALYETEVYESLVVHAEAGGQFSVTTYEGQARTISLRRLLRLQPTFAAQGYLQLADGQVVSPGQYTQNPGPYQAALILTLRSAQDMASTVGPLTTHLPRLKRCFVQGE